MGFRANAVAVSSNHKMTIDNKKTHFHFEIYMYFLVALLHKISLHVPSLFCLKITDIVQGGFVERGTVFKYEFHIIISFLFLEPLL